MNRHPADLAGFSLIEMALVLVMVALLLGGVMVPFGIQKDLEAIHEAQASLTLIEQALSGFAVTQGRLPCPDTDGDGQENCDLTPVDADNTPASGQCTRSVGRCLSNACEGGLPFTTLGLRNSDSWGSRFRYRVSSPLLAQSTTIYAGPCGSTPTQTRNGITLPADGEITIKTRGDDPTTPGIKETKALINLATNVPAVVISLGKNRYGSVNANGTLTATAPPAQNMDESTNAGYGIVKIARTSPSSPAGICSDTDESLAFCEFDDLLIWLSPHILSHRLIAAGKLP